MQKILTILRHAKAETGAANQEDKERGLVSRGLEATKIMGAYMMEKGLRPDLVLCSTARRTTETWLKIEQAFRTPLPTEYHDALYLASANEMLNLIAKVDASVNHLLVVGHNPGAHELAMKLAKEGDDQLIEKLSLKLPTCALARFICYAPDWATLRHARTELIDFISPKMLGQVITG